MEIREAQERLKKYYDDISEKRMKSMEMHMQHSAAVNERGVVFSQFLAALGAGLLAIFFGIDSFNELILNNSLFYSAIVLYSFTLLLFIFYTRERIDKDDKDIMDGYKKSLTDFEAASKPLYEELNSIDGVNMDRFYKKIETLLQEVESKNATEEEKAKKEPLNYFLELFIFLLLSVFWLILMSVKNWPGCYVVIGFIFIFLFTHNTKYWFLDVVKYYSRFVSSIFPQRTTM